MPWPINSVTHPSACHSASGSATVCLADIPMGLLINNTFNQWAGGKPPSSVNDWLQMMQGAGSFVTESVPALMAKLPNITLEGRSVNVAAETSKLLKSLPFFNNSTSMALPLPESMVGVGVAAPIINITQGVNVTMEVLQKLPEMLKQAGQAVVDGVQSLDLSNLEDAFTNEGGQLDIPKILKSTFNIDVPPPPNVTQVLGEVAKSLPVVAKQMGINPATVKFPDASALEGLLKLTNSKDLLITDGLGRVDLLATLAQLPQRLPELNDVASAVTKALPAPPQGMPSLDQVVAKVVNVTKAVASVAAKLQ